MRTGSMRGTLLPRSVDVDPFSRLRRHRDKVRSARNRTACRRANATICAILIFRDRQVLARAPFGPRAVVEPGLVLADGVEREAEDGGRHARAATGDDGPV